jgi:hypothetical protein
MIRGDTQLSSKDGLVRGVPKHSVRPVVDGIVTGLPRVAKPPVATPLASCHGSATAIPQAAFGSGIFGEGAAAVKHSAPEKKVRGRPKKDEKEKK